MAYLPVAVLRCATISQVNNHALFSVLNFTKTWSKHIGYPILTELLVIWHVNRIFMGKGRVYSSNYGQSRNWQKATFFIINEISEWNDDKTLMKQRKSNTLSSLLNFSPPLRKVNGFMTIIVEGSSVWNHPVFLQLFYLLHLNLLWPSYRIKVKYNNSIA